MKYKELLDISKEKLGKDFEQWCEKNKRTPLDPQSAEDFWNEEASNIEEFVSEITASNIFDNK